MDGSPTASTVTSKPSPFVRGGGDPFGKRLGRGVHKRPGRAEPLRPLQLACRDVAHIHLGAEMQRRKHGENANRPGADDQHLFARLDSGPLNAVVADAERFDQRRFPRGQTLRIIEAFDRNGEVAGKAAVPLRAHRFIVDAAIRLAAAAGVARAAVEVGVDRGEHAGPHAAIVFRRGNHFHSQFVAGYARVGSVGEGAPVGAEVGSADAAVQDLDEGLANLGFNHGRVLDKDGARFGDKHLLVHCGVSVPRLPDEWERFRGQ
ncbi:MAG: hypothetical protein LUE17_12430 [Planctomycetaceae bacterium]|nr:hypothetical protein [Planctomycetaceae bacterium]